MERRITATKKAGQEAQHIAEQADCAAESLADEEPGLAPLLKRAALPADGQELATLAEQIRHLQAARRKLKVLLRSMVIMSMRGTRIDIVACTAGSAQPEQRQGPPVLCAECLPRAARDSSHS